MIQSIFFFLLFTLIKIIGFLGVCGVLVTGLHFLQTLQLKAPAPEPPLKNRKKKVKDRIQMLAIRLNGEIQRLDDASIIHFQKNQTSYSLEIRQKRNATFVALNHRTWPDQNYYLRIDCRKHGKKLPIRSDQKVIPLKHPILDDDFVVESNSLELTNLIVNNRTASLIQFHLQHAHNRFSLRVVGPHFTLAGIATRTLANQQILALTNSFIRIHQSMLEGYRSKRVGDEAFAETPINIEADVSLCGEGICTVCGDFIQDRFRSCNKCQTRYHQDCWDYVGKCSTYGCYSRKWSPQPDERHA